MCRCFIFVFFIIFLFFSCSENSSSIEKYGDSKTLVGSDTISFPIDEETYYASRAMFQFEDNGKEYLFFKNRTNKGTSKIFVFDIEKECVHKTVPLYRQGPHGIPAIMGAYPINMSNYLITTNSTNFYIVNDSGYIKYKSPQLYSRRNEDKSSFCGTMVISRYHKPAIFKDSILYFPQSNIGYPHKANTWATSNIFAGLDFRTNEMKPTRFCYPSVFNKEELTRKLSYNCSHSYAYTGRDVAVSFKQSDSIYVSSDFEHVKAYLAKSRHAPSMIPEPYNAQTDNEVRLRREALEYDYWHLIYDKYRKVFYRFVRHPYEFPADRNAQFDEDRGRIFSIVILNDQYEIIGETTLPGHTYNYTLCFVGKKGLYISLNNQDNPIFSEDELFFQRFELVEK